MPPKSAEHTDQTAAFVTSGSGRSLRCIMEFLNYSRVDIGTMEVALIQSGMHSSRGGIRTQLRRENKRFKI
jgi:hypothetical protein